MSATRGERMTALLLAGWPQSDRRWALAQLPATQRGAIETLIHDAEKLPLALVSLDAVRGMAAPSSPVDADNGDDLLPIKRQVAALSPIWAARVLQALGIAPDAPDWQGTEPRRAAAISQAWHASGDLPPLLGKALAEIITRSSSARMPYLEFEPRHG